MKENELLLFFFNLHYVRNAKKDIKILRKTILDET